MVASKATIRAGGWRTFLSVKECRYISEYGEQNTKDNSE